MIPALTILDNFLVNERALEIREQALAAGFKDLQFMGGTYQGTGIEYKPDDMKQALERFFGAEVEIAISAFRSGHKGTTLHVNIHSDNVVGSAGPGQPGARWAGVYYLNLPEQCTGGTAFYKLKETGWDTMPNQEVLDASGHDIDWLRDKWTNKEAWDMTSLAGMKFNRMIVYPTEYFHSRFPLEGWGEKAEDARLVWVVFFDVIIQK